ncbi:hypothetical protein FOZ63_008071, partial [Perkinsus olseni]
RLDKEYEIRIVTNVYDGLVLFEFTDMTEDFVIYKIDRRNDSVEVLVEDDVFVGRPENKAKDWLDFLRFIPFDRGMHGKADFANNVFDGDLRHDLRKCRHLTSVLTEYNPGHRIPLDWVFHFYVTKEGEMRQKIKNKNRGREGAVAAT